MRPPDIVCLSHLPWAMEIERPHQVMRRLARTRRVFFVEDPAQGEGGAPCAELRAGAKNVHVLSLTVPRSASAPLVARERRSSVARLARTMRIKNPVLWVYAPTSVGAARDLQPSLLVYDCIDDHGARRSAPLDARAREVELLARADVVFTAGDTLFEAKRGRNVSTYPVPNSVDVEHFARRAKLPDVAAKIPSPRIGVLGTVDDRVSLSLIEQIATRRRDVQIVLVGPLDDVTPEELPVLPNVHWLGSRPYDELPGIVASWDVAIVPWLLDDATLRVEPAGVLPCIAAGVPVIATPLPALVERYAGKGVVTIADPSWFADAALRALEAPRFDPIEAAALLARTSWDRTVGAMERIASEAEVGRALALRMRPA